MSRGAADLLPMTTLLTKHQARSSSRNISKQPISTLLLTTTFCSVYYFSCNPLHDPAMQQNVACVFPYLYFQNKTQSSVDAKAVLNLHSYGSFTWENKIRLSNSEPYGNIFALLGSPPKPAILISIGKCISPGIK